MNMVLISKCLKSKAIEAQGDLHVYCMFIIKYYRKLGH